MSIHEHDHPQAGQEITVVNGMFAGALFRIENWWDRIAGRSWMVCDGNPACLQYAIRSNHPIDDEVIYGKIEGLGYLLHVSELGGGQ